MVIDCVTFDLKSSRLISPDLTSLGSSLEGKILGEVNSTEETRETRVSFGHVLGEPEAKYECVVKGEESGES